MFCLGVCLCTKCVYLVPEEAKRGCQIPWSYRRYWELNLVPPEEQPVIWFAKPFLLPQELTFSVNSTWNLPIRFYKSYVLNWRSRRKRMWAVTCACLLLYLIDQRYAIFIFFFLCSLAPPHLVLQTWIRSYNQLLQAIASPQITHLRYFQTFRNCASHLTSVKRL